MIINTFSIVVGTTACDAKCDFCVSRQTGLDPADFRAFRALSRHQNFRTAVRIAEGYGQTNLLLTGKGEPTLYPEEVTHFLNALGASRLNTKELQTNGLSVGRALHFNGDRNRRMLHNYLPAWATGGLDIIALSVVSIHDRQNASIYTKDEKNYPPLSETVRYLRRLGFTIRLSVMMMKGYVDSPETLTEVVEWCREHDVAQITARPIKAAWSPKDASASDFAAAHTLSEDEDRAITEYVAANSAPNRLVLGHGGIVYFFRKRNLCLTDCLTMPRDPDHIRTLIYYAGNGQVDIDWTEGATLLSGIPSEMITPTRELAQPATSEPSPAETAG